MCTESTAPSIAPVPVALGCAPMARGRLLAATAAGPGSHGRAPPLTYSVMLVPSYTPTRWVHWPGCRACSPVPESTR
nr:hypothetical protein DA06_22010 [Georgenia sp. SUBG003]